MRGTLLAALDRLEAALPKLLADADSWQSLDVDYEPPRVERLWRPFEENVRAFLHRIHPCEKALYHPHPWPSAVKILSGTYEMAVGYGAGEKTPPEAALIRLTAGASYEMVDKDGWHYVRPVGGPSLSIMVTGKPWERWAPRPKHELKALTDAGRADLLASFKKLYR